MNAIETIKEIISTNISVYNIAEGTEENKKRARDEMRGMLICLKNMEQNRIKPLMSL